MSSLKFYVAGPFNKKERVREIQRKVKDRGHDVIADWTDHKNIEDYSEESQLSAQYAVEDFDGAVESDVFVLIGSQGGRGSHLELGAALATETRAIYVIGEHREDCLFYFHPKIQRRERMEQVLDELESKQTK